MVFLALVAPEFPILRESDLEQVEELPARGAPLLALVLWNPQERNREAVEADARVHGKRIHEKDTGRLVIIS